jgi:hypothetical protein
LLLSLYSLIPPLRNEIKHLNFTVQRKRWWLYMVGYWWRDIIRPKFRKETPSTYSI